MRARSSAGEASCGSVAGDSVTGAMAVQPQRRQIDWPLGRRQTALDQCALQHAKAALQIRVLDLKLPEALEVNLARGVELFGKTARNPRGQLPPVKRRRGRRRR